MIKDLPIELPERICKEFISAKKKEPKALGWLKIHYHLLWAPVHKQLLYFTAKRFCKQVTVHIALMLPIVFFLKVRGDAQIKIGKTVRIFTTAPAELFTPVIISVPRAVKTELRVFAILLWM